MILGQVRSVSIGRAKAPAFEGPRATTGIDKRPVSGPVAVTRGGLAGDEQADQVHHGGRDQAVYAYAAEDHVWWADHLGTARPDGAFGENLTTVGFDVNAAVIGECWRIGSTLLQITSPRIPCRMFAGWIGEEQWMKRFAHAARPGAYLRVLEQGSISATDAIHLVDRPAESLTLAEAITAYYGDRELLPRLRAAPALATRWRAMAEERLQTGKLLRLPDRKPSAENE
ncbi:MOSC domain-containing protein [Streptomyces sp. MUM 203J]|uniref:MOSC domain-containing protein n=1 Tax=Streptomyces sp. MUM 203J TaxID=2791990 RepID=UPI001F045607|nr:MOSC domain-containing protein [Streptomyces sp. MUM 203J]